MTLQGKTVAVVAPAGIPNMDNIAQAVALLESWGLRVTLGAHVAERFRHLAGPLEHRAGDLAAALADPAVDIVWIARAGYGCAHVLPSLPDAIPPGKTVIGFSDVTALFCALRHVPGIRLIHGPTLNSLAAQVDDLSRQSVHDALTGAARAPIALDLLHGPADAVEGPIAGGNITVLASMGGSRWQPQFRDAIVVLEDVTELAYRLDRSIMTLRHASMLDGARAIVLGEFVRCPVPPGADYTLNDVLLDVLGPLGLPVYGGLPVGHGDRNLSWVYGQHAAIRDGALRLG
ncbi:S66 peptidase family protein [Paraburkholderia phosphatilytica]|uniref:S66 peptidase family protein n=1 Tax=Paraburkholderia phosphatilytica TaxID=2282883 RepID=UPI000E4D0632|nr:LD-carboxypeptidase [Paraburkholderia phosphatilytica]